MVDPADLRSLFDQATLLAAGERARFIDGVRQRNVELGRELTRLLDADARLGSAFDSLGEDSSGSDTRATDAPALRPGTRLGPYEIIATLGAGGMGEVYEARDTRLGRIVALKVLLADMIGDPTARSRFEREAQVVASLSHAHICPLFDVGRDGPIDYLVMEFLAGETLATRLQRGRLPLDHALTCGRQIAEALAAAHRAGIVHRDLKPGNVMLTKGGVKLLDFGLARHTEAASGDAMTVAMPEPITGTGAMLGTVPYMAPEQLEGRPVDARTDIFAFGLVLYEMVTGRRAFQAFSHAALIGSILRDDPPSLSTVDPALPPGLDRVIRRCLAKAPAERWQSIEDVQTALLEPPPAGRRGLAIATAGVVVVGLVAGLVAALWPSPSAVPRVVAFRRVTHDTSRYIKEYPFTDGTRIYYASWTADLLSTALFQAPITGGESVPLPTPIPHPFVKDIFPGGTELLVSDGAGQLYVMPVPGGQPRPLGDIHSGDCALSRDGRRLAFCRGNDLFVASADGSGVRKILTAPNGLRYLRWAPDGQRVGYTMETGSQRTLWEVAVDGGAARRILPDWPLACCGDWTPDGRYFVFEAEREGDYGLWALPEARRWTWSGPRDAQPVKLTTGPMRYENSRPGPDGRTVLALGTPPSAGELARFDPRSGQFVSMAGGLSARDAEFSRDAQWIAYVNPADETLWRCRADGGDRRQLTFPPARVGLPRWSPDGTQIAYTSKRPGDPSRVFVIAAEGGQARQVSEGADIDDASWSADGQRLVYATTPQRLQIVDLRTGSRSDVPGSDGLFSPQWSPDGASIAATSAGNGNLMLYQISSGRWRNVARGVGLWWPNWTRDGAHLQGQRGSDVIRVRISDGQIAQVARLDGVRREMLEGGRIWLGKGPDDAPLLMRDTTPVREVYALEIEWP